MSANLTVPTTTIRRLLVANRGEIARRIIRSAHEMGIDTVAVYADDDRDAPHVREAGQAYSLVGRSSAETYLDQAKVLEVARRSGADAVHPGYGFLSENAGFAAAVEASGLIWVGPPPAAIAAMGDKLQAKRLAIAAGVPTQAMLSGTELEDPTAVAALGYPLLVKASAGGGGKGMRVVAEPGELAEALASARREAAASFGDDTVFLERYVTRARHIEVQVLGDRHGNVVHLFERECSIQRRHQKVIEEAPSSALDDAARAELGASAVAVARAVGYHNAGTVEFLYDEDRGEFSFLEMNTRLQVEHPVTEAITGLDLVREQLRVAAGEALGYEQAEIARHGHAIEVRLYAEDPAKDFLPAAGPVTVWQPAPSPTVRYDSGVEQGSVVGVEFDPMLAKVIAHAPTRREAALKLALALERTRIGGLTTNRDFLVATLRHPAFLDGDTTTDFIERHRPSPALVPSQEDRFVAATVAALWQAAQNRSQAAVLASIPGGWRNSVMPPQRFELATDATDATNATEEGNTLEYARQRDGSFMVTCGAARAAARVLSVQGSRIDIELDGRRLSASVATWAGAYLVDLPGGTVELRRADRFPQPDTSGPAGGLVAPMPGKIIEVRAVMGDAVRAGQVLVIMEAMKMEHHLSASVDGTVTEVRVAVGEQVDNGAVLLVVADG
ncbi:MAG: acetyl/propionyl/methylcrotonyl-CoA carboxylase subunit alpha [Acidimicrobiales bacterium]